MAGAPIAVVAGGLGVLIARSPAAFTAITYAGAAYLVYLGIRLILRKDSAFTTTTRYFVPDTRPLASDIRSLWYVATL